MKSLRNVEKETSFESERNRARLLRRFCLAIEACPSPWASYVAKSRFRQACHGLNLAPKKVTVTVASTSGAKPHGHLGDV